MTLSHAEATEAYAQHFNFFLRVREEEWDEDAAIDFWDQTERAKREMQDAWLEEFAR